MSHAVTARHLRIHMLALTQSKMADEMGVSLRTWCRWEAGYMPKAAVKALVNLADVSGFKVVILPATDNAPEPGCAQRPGPTAPPPGSAGCLTQSPGLRQSACSVA